MYPPESKNMAQKMRQLEEEILSLRLENMKLKETQEQNLLPFSLQNTPNGISPYIQNNPQIVPFLTERPMILFDLTKKPPSLLSANNLFCNLTGYAMVLV